MEFFTIQGSPRPKRPQAFVLVDALTGVAISSENPLAVSLGTEGLQLTGAINIGTAMEISNDEGNPIPVIGPLTNSELRTTPLPVSGTLSVTGPLTDTQLRSTALSVSGPLTNTELRNTALPVTGSVSITGTTPVSGPVTDAQLRSVPLPVSGTVTVTGALTDTQLRASSVPVSLASVPTHGVTGTFWQSVQPVSASTLPLPSGAATSAKQPALGVAGVPSVDVLTVQGSSTMTALKVDGSATTQPVSGPLTDTQLRSSAVTVTGTVAAVGDFYQNVQPVSLTSQPLPTGAATSAKQPVIGTSGTPSVDVLSVQGTATMTPFKVDGSATTQPVSGAVSILGTVPVSGGLTDAQLRQTPVAISGSVSVTGSLTDTQLRSSPVVVSGPLSDVQIRATPLPVSGTIAVTGALTDTQLRNSPIAVSGSVAVTGALTNSEIRAAALAVTGPLTSTQLRATPLEVTGGLTDIQLRATSVSVSGPATNTELRSTPLPVSGTVTAIGPLTNAELRFSAIPVSGPLTDAQLRSLSVSVSGPATNDQLRATPLPVTGSFSVIGALTNDELRATPLPVTGSFTVTGGLTDTQLRASSVPVSLASVPTHGVTGTFWQATQPVSAASLPLPSGAATSAKQPALGTAGTASADVITVQGTASMTALKVDGSAVTQPVSIASVPTHGVTGTFWQGTQPVSASTLPLPTGAATAIKQPALGTFGAPSIDVLSVQGSASMTALKVDGSAVTQPVSIASQPLPTGAATSAKQPVLGTSGAPSVDVLSVQGTTSMTPFKVDGSAFTQPVSLLSVPTHAVTVSGNVTTIGTFWQATQPISASTLPLPVGAATASKQPSLGTAGAASLDVLTVQGAASMVPFKVDGSGVTQPVSGTVSVSGTVPVSISSVPTHGVTGTFWQSTQPVSIASIPLPAGAALSSKQPAIGISGTPSVDVMTVQGAASMTPFKVDGSATTQPVSGTVGISGTVNVVGSVETTGTFWQATQPVSLLSLPLPAGSATSAKQPSIGASGVPSADVLSVQGTATMTPFKVDGSATTQPISGAVSVSNTVAVTVASIPTHGVTGTFWQSTQPVSASALPLPAGAATSAKQPAIGVSGTPSVDVLTVQGSSTMTALKVDGSSVTQPVSGTVSVSGTVPVSILSVPTHGVTGTFWQTTQPVSIASQPLPAGAATSAKQPAIGTSGTPSTDVLTVQGSALMTALKVDGSAVTQPVSLSSVPTHGVTGTFWQTTQPVSGSVSVSGSVAVTGPVTDAQLRATPLPVTGSFSVTGGLTNTELRAAAVQVLGPATNAELRNTPLPVSGSLSVINTVAVSVATVPTHGVTGTFWQATQPVSISGALATTSVTDAVHDSTVITGGTIAMAYGSTAFQPPVSAEGDAVRLWATRNGALNIADAGGSITVDGTFWPATQPVSGTVQATSTTDATHDFAAPTGGTMVMGIGSNSWPTAVTADGDAVRLWTTRNGALNIADGGGTITVDGTFWQATQPVSGPVTNSELRASALLVTGPATDAQLRASALSVIGPITNAEIRAAPITVTGTSDAINDNAASNNGSMGMGYAYTSFPPAVSADGDAVRLWTTRNGALNIADGGGTITVDGTFWQATQPVSIASVPVHGVTGTFWQATQPISAISLPLPTGGATSAKQPAFGVSGTPSVDVLTVQGSATMTSLKVDGSAVTQPVSVINLTTCMDSTGVGFNPESCSHVFGYSNGLLVTDTATNGASIWIKTYTYVSYDLTGESKWVKQ